MFLYTKLFEKLTYVREKFPWHLLRKKIPWVNNNLTEPKAIVVKNILDIIILCISIIVFIIPEGLPLAVTLSLAFSIKEDDFFKVNSNLFETLNIKPGSWLGNLIRRVNNNEKITENIDFGNGISYSEEFLAKKLLYQYQHFFPVFLFH